MNTLPLVCANRGCEAPVTDDTVRAGLCHACYEYQRRVGQPRPEPIVTRHYARRVRAALLDKLDIGVCRMCDTAFQRARHRRVYCSQECHIGSLRRLQPRPCAHCSQPFARHDYNARFCSRQCWQDAAAARRQILQACGNPACALPTPRHGIRRGRCSACYVYWLRYGVERPERLARPTPKRCANPVCGRLVKSWGTRCGACYGYRRRTGHERPAYLANPRGAT